MATDTPDETPVEEEIPTEDEISITFDEVDDDPAASEPVLNLDLGGDDEADDETEISLNFGQDEAEEVVDPSDTEAVAVAALRSELRSKFGEWYVVHTYSGMENRVKQNLEQRVKALNMEDYIFEAVVPTEEVVEIRNGSRKTVTRTSHPGYVLVRMELTDDSWSAVRHTPSVTGFLGYGNNPVPLAIDEVVSMLSRAAIAKANATHAPSARRKKVEVADFAVGDSVMVVDGPFAGVHASITEIHAHNQKVKALVDFMGRETPVELTFSQIQKA